METDTIGDGKLDTKTIQHKTDTNEDGNPERVEHVDANSGKVIQTDIDEDSNGVVERKTFDANGDGNPDRVEHYNNDSGKLASADVDRDDNGIVEIKETYDENGKVKAREYYSNDANNAVDHVEHYQYDNQGRLLETKFFNDGDAQNDNQKADRIETNEYNDAGLVVKKYINEDGSLTGKQKVTGDNRSVMGVDEIRTFTYDDKGRVTQVAIDGDADGTADRSEYYEYEGDSDKVKKIYYNDDLKDSPDRMEIREYDSNGNLATRYFYNDANAMNNGKADRIETYEYDPRRIQFNQNMGNDAFHNGNEYRYLTAIKIDTDGDTKEDETHAYTNNSKGYALKIAYNLDAEGEAEAVEYFVRNAQHSVIEKYTNTDNGNSGEEKVINGETVQGIDAVETYTLNANGEIIKTQYDKNADNTVDMVEYFVRNANGHIEKKYIDSDNKSTGEQKTINGERVQGVDKAESYVLNAKGQIIQINFDANADGNTDKIRYIEVNQNGDRIAEYHNNNVYNTSGYDREVNGVVRSGIDFIAKYTLDKYGNVALGEYSNGADSKDTVIFIRDAHRKIIKELRNEDNNKATGNDEYGTDRIKTFTLDAYGRIIKVDQQDNPNKPVNYIEYRKYDALNNLIEVRKDNGADKSIDAVERYSYNAKNERIKEEFFTEAEANKANGKPHTTKTFKLNPSTAEKIEVYTEHGDKPFQLYKVSQSQDNSLMYEEFYRYNQYGNKYLFKKITQKKNPITGKFDQYYIDQDGDNKIDEMHKVTRDHLDRDIQKDVYTFTNGVEFSIAESLPQGNLDKIEYYTPKEPNKVQGKYYNLDPLAEQQNNGYATGMTIQLEDGRTIVGIDKFEENTLNGQSQVIIKRTVDTSQNEDKTVYKILNDQGAAIKEYYDFVKNVGNTFEIHGKSVSGIDRISILDLENDGHIRLFNYIDTDANGKTDQLLIEQVNSTLDFRTWTNEKFAEIGNELKYIFVSGDKANSTVILDTASLAKLAGVQKSLYISASWNDAWPHTAEGNKLDTIQLKGFSIQDKQAATVSHQGAEYHKYVKNIDGSEYHLFIDSDFNPIF